MPKIAVLGVGDMGSGLAKNLLKSGYQVSGYDPSSERMTQLQEMGGHPAISAYEAAQDCDGCFVMVMNGDQVKSVVFGDENTSNKGIIDALKAGSVIFITATIKGSEVREIAEKLEGSGIDLIDSPVSGGFPGAQAGTLTMMAAAPEDTFKRHHKIMEAVGEKIFHVGEEPGMGQTIKACLQALIGSIFSATFEAAVMASKAGVSGQALFDVFTNSSAGSGITNNALQKILDRQFYKTGSHIATMYKDLTLSMDLSREVGAPLFTAAAAMQLFEAGKTKHPDGDNWVVTKVLEDIAGTEVKW